MKKLFFSIMEESIINDLKKKKNFTFESSNWLSFHVKNYSKNLIVSL